MILTAEIFFLSIWARRYYRSNIKDIPKHEMVEEEEGEQEGDVEAGGDVAGRETLLRRMHSAQRRACAPTSAYDLIEGADYRSIMAARLAAANRASAPPEMNTAQFLSASSDEPGLTEQLRNALSTQVAGGERRPTDGWNSSEPKVDLNANPSDMPATFAQDPPAYSPVNPVGKPVVKPTSRPPPPPVPLDDQYGDTAHASPLPYEESE